MSNEAMAQGALFDRYAPFVQDFIYRQNWAELRAVQTAAARVLFESEDHLLLSGSTASGKTEAVFFPILTMLWEDPPKSIGCLYIAPLKSLINDQFYRMETLLDESGIPVTHWHGDVPSSQKEALLRCPRGILQITPESLEAMLLRRPNDIYRLFCDLRFVVIDEIHALMGSDRGDQILCQLCRIARLIGHTPRRIGLSATMGEPQLAARWLAGGTDIAVQHPDTAEAHRRIRLGMEHFFVQNDAPDQSAPLSGKTEQRAAIDAGYEYIYACVKEKKALVFSNSREETEFLTATLRQIAARRGEPDRFLIHHGNLSAALREEAEAKMKDDAQNIVTCATVTLELGVDIGRLDRVMQAEAPHSVSSFLQRLGRSGRRGAPPEMMMVFREENPTPETPLPQLIPWNLLRGIALVQLTLEEQFIEPPRTRKMPLSLLFHQTLSVLGACGELSPRALAQRVLTLPPFEHIDPADYKALLIGMIASDYLEMTEEKGLILGLRGEKLINNFRFFAVFRDQNAEFSVRCESDEIGTITSPVPVGDRFALAGRVWEVTELDVGRKLVFVKSVPGKMEVSWPGDYGEVHTKIVQRMRQILLEDTEYPYLKENAMARLRTARALARATHLAQKPLLSLGGMSYALFPWLGTRAFRTLRRYLKAHAAGLGLSNLSYEGCYFMVFRLEDGAAAHFFDTLCSLSENGIDPQSLIGAGETPIFEKYDPMIPAALLKKAFALDRLDPAAAAAALKRMRAEQEKTKTEQEQAK